MRHLKIASGKIARLKAKQALLEAADEIERLRKAVELAECVVKAGEALRIALNEQAVAIECDREDMMDGADDAREKALRELEKSIDEFRKQLELPALSSGS